MTYNSYAIKVSNISKCYHIYDKPHKRLQQSVYPYISNILCLSTSKYYKEFWALKNISFEINKGEIVGIIGRNGSGKSTLLQMICGTGNPTSGNIFTNGRIAALLELGSGFNPEFTGKENIYLNAALLGLSKYEIDDRFDDIVAFADIGDFINQPVKTYSSGMYVRLAFAVSVGVSPDILIVDEALAVGDAEFHFKCMNRLQELTQSGMTLLFVSHDMGLIKNLCTKVIYLDHGQIKIFGASDNVTEHYLQDIQIIQSHSRYSKIKVKKNNNIGINNSLAFGTSQAGIIASRFFLSGDTHMVVKANDKVKIEVDIEFSLKLADVTLCVLITDRRLIGISGGIFPVKPASIVNNTGQSTVVVEFESKFIPGNYYLTLRLESRKSRLSNFILDKQPAALSFEVSPYEPSFIGIADIGMREIVLHEEKIEIIK